MELGRCHDGPRSMRPSVRALACYQVQAARVVSFPAHLFLSLPPVSELFSAGLSAFLRRFAHILLQLLFCSYYPALIQVGFPLPFLRPEHGESSPLTFSLHLPQFPCVCVCARLRMVVRVSRVLLSADGIDPHTMLSATMTSLQQRVLQFWRGLEAHGHGFRQL